MYKTQLQELCQRKSWRFPEYASMKQGASHDPLFKSTVTVNGVSFESPVFCKTLKQSQAEAAKLACLHFTSSSSSGDLPLPNKPTVDSNHMYKTQLQAYALKNGLGLPEYACFRDGPPHASRFSCKLSVGQETFESPEFFTTLKEAENAVANLALKALAAAVHPETSVVPEASVVTEASIVSENSFPIYKNLLQELCQKEGFELPTYGTERCGLTHMPTFISTVEVKGETYRGEPEKTKKLAETNAAKVAYISIKQRTCQHVETKSSNLKSTTTVLNKNAVPQKHIEHEKDEYQESSKVKLMRTLESPFPNRNDGSGSSSDTGRKRGGDSQQNAGLTSNLMSEKPTGPATNTVPRKKVCIQARKLNMKLPPGTEVCSDERWIATETTPEETDS